VGVLSAIVVEPEAVGTGAALVKGSVGNEVSEDSATRDTSILRWTFAVWERIQSGHVDQLASLRTGSSFLLERSSQSLRYSRRSD
jgi:hypothetical protein